MILVKSPYRVSLFGGGTDYIDFILENGLGLCVGFAIDKYSYISVRKLPEFFNYKTRLSYSQIELVNNNKDITHTGIRYTLEYMKLMDHGLEITHTSDLPAKTGLGTSSAFLVALVRALYIYKNFNIGPIITATIASNIEQIYSYVGLQDHLFSAIGGCGELSFSSLHDKSGIKKVCYSQYNQYYYDLFEQNGLLFFTGEQRCASDILSKYISDIPKSEYQKEILEKACEVSVDMINMKADLCYLGEALDWVWRLKKKISKNISNDRIDEIYKQAIESGAIGGKLLGAGGGGCLFFLANKEDHNKIIETCKGLGCIHIPYKISEEGCKRII